MNVLRRMLNENKTEEGLLRALLRTLDHLALDVFMSHGQEIAPDLHQAVSIPCLLSDLLIRTLVGCESIVKWIV